MSTFTVTKRSLLNYLGIVLVLTSLLILARIFAPVAQAELYYQQTRALSSPPSLNCPISDFTLGVPALNLCANVIPQVDPFDSHVYQTALTKGIAHAKGTSLPGQGGNIFLFSHSAGNPLDATRYNSLFYLLSKLTIKDTLTLTYQGKIYSYRVESLVKVNPDQLDYLKPSSSDTLTLMTCWPPGTTLKRLIVVAKPVAL